MSTKQENSQPTTDLATVPTDKVGVLENLGIELTDPKNIQWEIAERMALAATPEELFGEDGPLGLREHMGKPFYVRDVYWLPSGKPGGAGFYAVIKAADGETGEPVMYTTGALSVLMQLARAKQQGWLDRKLVAQWSAEESADGNRPYKLALA